MSYLVYLPPSYEPQPAARYPVVYWLHGLNGDQRGGVPFVEQLDAAIRAGKAPAMIAVLVNGMRDSFYCDSKDGKWPVESVIIKELIPHIDKTYRTITRQRDAGRRGLLDGRLRRGAPGVQVSRRVRNRGRDGRGADRAPRRSPAGRLSNDVRRRQGLREGERSVRAGAEERRRDPRPDHDPHCGRRPGLASRSRQALHELLGELKIEHEFEQVPGWGTTAALFYKTLGAGALAYYQKALSGPPVAGNWPNASAPSHRSQRGDVEILSFDTEETYDRLAGALSPDQETQPTPGEMTTLYYRSKLDGSVQPYSVRLPRGYTKEKKYPLVIQLHGTNFKEVLTGSRLRSQRHGGAAVDPARPAGHLRHTASAGRPPSTSAWARRISWPSSRR